VAEQYELFKVPKIGGNLKRTNPMLKWGAGPLDKTCKDCAELTYNETAKRYYKCKRRGITSGAGTDHRVGWPACTYFVQTEE
jgi:hypothetical protein